MFFVKSAESKETQSGGESSDRKTESSVSLR